MSEADGGSAFPEIMTDVGRIADGDVYPDTYSYGGMSLRDYFAAKALAGIVTRDEFNGTSSDWAATLAYRYADAMLLARKVNP